MAEHLWNKVDIPFPGAVSSVRVRFTYNTDKLVKNALVANETVLRLVDSETLQTEIRVLYALLYKLNNSYRGNKSYKGLQQVEQCVNRLKNMKLVETLQEFSQLCPSKVQRRMGLASGECNVPSQPMLEWLCLKVLGAANLMNQTLRRCSRAFLLCNQQMKVEEFLVLNVVETSLISRLWVIFRGVLVSLSALYEETLRLRSEVAKTKPMPFLGGLLPPNLSEILDPELLHDETCKGNVKQHPPKSRPTQRYKIGQKRREDLGVSIERDINDNSDLRSYFNIYETFTNKRKPNCIAAQIKVLKTNVHKSSSFFNIDVHLEKVIQWYKLRKMGKNRCIFNHLRLKCKKMKGLESDGYNVQKKLYRFRREVFKACSGRLVPRRTPGSFAPFHGRNQTKTKFHLASSRFAKTCARKRNRKRSRKSRSSKRRQNKDGRTEDKAIPQSSHCDRRDDIDDIFSSLGL
ncbi:unnamed protein product [Knipowitschia caucasica]